MTEAADSRTGKRSPRPADAYVRTTGRINRSTGSKMHELGNLMVAVHFCLRQLRGQQGTEELERLVRTGLGFCEEGMAAFRKVHEAMHLSGPLR